MKVLSNVPPDLEDEAIAAYDKHEPEHGQSSKRLLELPIQERFVGLNEYHWGNFFWFVFAYCVAKGWKP